MNNIKNEALFLVFVHTDYLPSEIGRKQFWDKQSLGIQPENPDTYYDTLTKGKQVFDYLTREYYKMYISNEWWGFLPLWEDWEGQRWVLPFLCAWYPSLTGRKLPKWMGIEGTLEEIKILNESELTN